MEVKDISYTKLQLAVIEGAVDLSLLNIFKETRVDVATFGMKIHAGIIGTSHFVRFEKMDGTAFTEIFACDVLEKKESKSLCFLPIQKITTPVNIDHSFASYQFSQKRQSYTNTASQISSWAKKEEKNQPLVFLEYHFNIEKEDCSTSRTILVIHTTEDGFRINTVHEYQEEDVIILSESFLKI